MMSDRTQRWGWRIIAILVIAALVMFFVGEVAK